MANENDESLFDVTYAGEGTVDEVYDAIRDLEKDGKVDIKTAATVNRQDNGKLRLKHKRRVTFWNGPSVGGSIGLVLAGLSGGAVAGAAAVGAVVGG